jgi:hypothetical protein
MKATLITVMLILCVFLALWVWVSGRLDTFTAACTAAGGRVEMFGTNVGSNKCLTPDGRVIDIPGP